MSAPCPHGAGCRICVSVAESSVAGVAARFDAVDGADLIEVRLDALAPGRATAAAVAEIIDAAPLPVGFTFRPRWQGGMFGGDESVRRALLEAASTMRVAFVDVELEASWAAEFARSSAVQVVLSHHWWTPGAADLQDKIERAVAIAPAMIKLVGTAARADDAVPFLRAAAAIEGAGVRSACFCMGEAGRASRLIAAARGAGMIYAAPAGGGAVAPGQWALPELVDVFRLPEWGPDSEIYGLIGDPIAHSLSPAIFNAAFAGATPARVYIPLAGSELDAVLRLARAAAVRGVSVTMPFKAPMAARSVAGDAVVASTGAANTVVYADREAAGGTASNTDGAEGINVSESGTREAAGGTAFNTDGAEGIEVSEPRTREAVAGTAFNTDGGAVVDALASVEAVAGARIGIVGAGGAARAAAAALLRAGAAVTIFNRSQDRARAAAEMVSCECAPLADLAGAKFDVVINATPVGMRGTDGADDCPFPPAWLSGREVVFDMVYRPRRTPLLRAAAARGCRTVDGLEMFVRQAAAQYRHLTGDCGNLPLARMRATAERILDEGSPVAQDSAAGGTSGALPSSIPSTEGKP